MAVANSFIFVAATGVLRVPLSLRSDVGGTTTPEPRDVLTGERMAAHVVAPAAGTLGAAVEVSLTGGARVPAVELTIRESSSPPPPVEPLATDHPPVLPATAGREQLSEWITRLSDAGIAAHRRASPDLLAQLFRSLQRPVDTVICNLLDTDSVATLNVELLRTFPREIVAGTSVVAKLVGANRAWLAVDARASLTGTGLRRIARQTPAMKIVLMANDYPQPDPTLLMYTLLGRRLRPARLPVEQGCVVLDGAAALAIGRLAVLNEPMLRVPVAVRDHGHAGSRGRAHYALAPIGLPISRLLMELGLPTHDVCLRGGDLLRDVELPQDAVVAPSELVIHHSDAEPPVNPDPCVRCGWCFEGCPTRVQPANVLDAAQRADLDLAERAGVEACIECGICSYVCPSKLPLLQGLRIMRKKLADDAAKVVGA